jgi:hypothetical protein
LPSMAGVETRVIREGESLPFASESFDVITCLEVIEHLILTTPHKGWLTWMDPGNVKLALPAS